MEMRNNFNMMMKEFVLKVHCTFYFISKIYIIFKFVLKYNSLFTSIDAHREETQFL